MSPCLTEKSIGVLAAVQKCGVVATCVSQCCTHTPTHMQNNWPCNVFKLQSWSRMEADGVLHWCETNGKEHRGSELSNPIRPCLWIGGPVKSIFLSGTHDPLLCSQLTSWRTAQRHLAKNNNNLMADDQNTFFYHVKGNVKTALDKNKKTSGACALYLVKQCIYHCHLLVVYTVWTCEGVWWCGDIHSGSLEEVSGLSTYDGRRFNTGGGVITTRLI